MPGRMERHCLLVRQSSRSIRTLRLMRRRHLRLRSRKIHRVRKVRHAGHHCPATPRKYPRNRRRFISLRRPPSYQRHNLLFLPLPQHQPVHNRLRAHQSNRSIRIRSTPSLSKSVRNTHGGPFRRSIMRIWRRLGRSLGRLWPCSKGGDCSRLVVSFRAVVYRETC